MNLDLVKEYTLQEVEELAVQTCPICQNPLKTHRDEVLKSNWWVKCSACDFRLNLFQWQDGMFTCFGAEWQCYRVDHTILNVNDPGILIFAHDEKLLKLQKQTIFDFNTWLPKLDKLLLIQ